MTYERGRYPIKHKFETLKYLVSKMLQQISETYNHYTPVYSKAPYVSITQIFSSEWKRKIPGQSIIVNNRY